MTARNPLDEHCDGSLFCPVDDHILVRRRGAVRKWSHIKLTPGQQAELRERRDAKRPTPSTGTQTESEIER